MLKLYNTAANECHLQMGLNPDRHAALHYFCPKSIKAVIQRCCATTFVLFRSRGSETMNIKNLSYLSEYGAELNEEHMSVNIPLDHGGSVVGYFPIESVQIYAYDVHGGELPDLLRMGLRQPERGRYLRTIACRSGSCEFVKNGRSAILKAGEVSLDYGKDAVPISLSASDYVGVEVILQVEEVIRESVMYMLMHQSIKTMKLSDKDVKENFMFYFNMSPDTKFNIDRLLKYCQSASDPSIVLIKAAEIGHDLGVDLQNSKSSCRTFVTKSQLMVAEDIHRALTEEYDKKWVAAYFAEKYGVSTTTVKHYFKSVFGYDYKEYQMKVRMENAARMLTETSLSVGEISSRVGYATHAKFGVVFKKTYGITPMEYRRANKFHQANRSRSADSGENFDGGEDAQGI